MGIHLNDRFTTVIIDTSVICHQLHEVLVGCGVDGDHYMGVVKAQLTWLMSGDWLGSLKPQEYQIVLVCDTKENGEYWRNSYLRDPAVYSQVPQGRTKKPRTDPIAYKAGRKLPEYNFTKLKGYIYDLAAQQSWRMIRVPGYEADDLAAAMVHINADLGLAHNLILATVDADWLGLCDLDAVAWYCVKGWSPRVRYQLPEINSWCQRRLKVTLDHPRDIWAVKAKQGDKSDNLPAGSPIDVIDLFEPPAEHRLWQKPGVRGVLTSWLTDPLVQTYDSTKALGYLRQLGIQPFIRCFDPDRDIWMPSLAA